MLKAANITAQPTQMAKNQRSAKKGFGTRARRTTTTLTCRLVHDPKRQHRIRKGGEQALPAGIDENKTCKLGTIEAL